MGSRYAHDVDGRSSCVGNGLTKNMETHTKQLAGLAFGLGEKYAALNQYFLDGRFSGVAKGTTT